jgi:hypothetical protein
MRTSALKAFTFATAEVRTQSTAFHVQQQYYNTTSPVSGLSPDVVTKAFGIMSFTDADLLEVPMFMRLQGAILAVEFHTAKRRRQGRINACRV